MEHISQSPRTPRRRITGWKSAGRSLPFLLASSLGALPANAQLDTSQSQNWNQDTPGVLGTRGADAFGQALAVGDFDGDRCQDLAVGAPRDDDSGAWSAGAVQILYGTATGLTPLRNQLWHQNQPGVVGVAQSDDYYGLALAAGDFDADGIDDLAVGIPKKDVSMPTPGNHARPTRVVDAGAVHVLYGTADDRYRPCTTVSARMWEGPGLTADRDQLWHQGSPYVEGSVDAGDVFGSALAVGDFDTDGAFDLAIGIPGEEVDGVANAGAVQILYGSSSGLAFSRSQLWHQNNTLRSWWGQFNPDAAPNDRFGSALATGDWDGDGFHDLAIGIPNDRDGQGAFQILYGGPSGLGLDGPGNQRLWRARFPYYESEHGFPLDSSTASEFGLEHLSDGVASFGFSLTSGDLDGDGRDDLAVGAYDANLLAEAAEPIWLPFTIDAGGVLIFTGGETGLSVHPTEVYAGVTHTHYLGTALAIGDLDGDWTEDLVIASGADAVGVRYSWGFVPMLVFGSFPAVGDFDANYKDDLAVGEPSVGVNVYYAR